MLEIVVNEKYQPGWSGPFIGHGDPSMAHHPDKLDLTLFKIVSSHHGPALIGFLYGRHGHG
jgi:hypothetical protein